jgi:hypothetical protein
VKIRPWGAAKAEGMGAFFNTLLTAQPSGPQAAENQKPPPAENGYLRHRQTIQGMLKREP